MTIERRFLIAFIALSLLLAIGMPILSQDYGITWDEWVHAHYGKLTWRYFLSWGADRECLSSGAGMGDFRLQYYGHFFDTVATGIYGLVRGSLKAAVYEEVSWDRFYETKHAVNALFGCWAMIFTGLAARQIAGWRSGFLALLLIAATPTFFGHSMNNPKDIPFAGSYIFSLYFLLRYLREFPNPKRLSIWGLIASIAISINIRIGGLLLIGYFVLFTIIHVSLAHRAEWRRALRDIIFISLAGYFGGLIFWPYGHQNPFVNPWLSLQEMSKYQLQLGNLFEGNTVLSTQVPWYYIPKWVFITAPLAVLLGFALYPVLSILKKNGDKTTALRVLVLYFSIAFPIVYAILVKSSFYDSWRHFLFIYPPLVVVAALTWNSLIGFIPKNENLIGGIILFTLLLHPVKFMVKNHPHQYVYFNQTVKGIDGAFSNYDTDYWGNSLRLGAEWLADYLKKQGGGEPVVVSSDGSLIQTAYYLRPVLGDRYIPFDLDKHKDHWWDYGIVLSRNWKKKDLLSGAWPPPGTIHQIKADNVTLCAVVKVIDFYIKNKDATFQSR